MRDATRLRSLVARLPASLRRHGLGRYHIPAKAFSAKAVSAVFIGMDV